MDVWKRFIFIKIVCVNHAIAASFLEKYWKRNQHVLVSADSRFKFELGLTGKSG